MTVWKVEPARDGDKDWVGEIFNADAKYLGADFGAIWYRWQTRETARDRWTVVRPFGFAHYLERLDGVKVLYEIAVRSDMRRKGIGRALLAEIGRPVELKTDHNNAEANNFYLALGFSFKGAKPSQSGKKLMNLYRLD